VTEHERMQTGLARILVALDGLIVLNNSQERQSFNISHRDTQSCVGRRDRRKDRKPERIKLRPTAAYKSHEIVLALL